MTSCPKHEPTQISFEGTECPLCSHQRGMDAIAMAATRCGLLIVKLHLAGIPFALAFPQGSQAIGQASQAELVAALEEMQKRMNGGAAPAVVAPPRRSMIIPA